MTSYFSTMPPSARLTKADPGHQSILDTVDEKLKEQIEAECSQLSEEAQDLEKQIEELTGEPAFGRSEV